VLDATRVVLLPEYLIHAVSCLHPDSIYEEALNIRESYCTSIRSAAYALRHAATSGGGEERKDAANQQQTWQNNISGPLGSQQPPVSTHGSPHGSPNQFVPSGQHQFEPKPAPIHVDGSNAPPITSPATVKSSYVLEPTNDAKLHQEQVPRQNAAAQAKSPPKPSAPSEKAQTQTSSNQEQPKEQPEQFESADSALPIMIVSLFSLFFSIIWFICIKLPYRLCSLVLTFCFILMTCRLLWLLLADDNGAWEMGAGVDYEYNAPGIY
jgi:hypothetical protein